MGEAKRLGSAVAVLFLILLLTDIAPGIGANVEASINAVMRRIGSALENRSGCREPSGCRPASAGASSRATATMPHSASPGRRAMYRRKRGRPAMTSLEQRERPWARVQQATMPRVADDALIGSILSAVIGEDEAIATLRAAARHLRRLHGLGAVARVHRGLHPRCCSPALREHAHRVERQGPR